MLRVTNPMDGRLIREVHLASREELECVVELSAKAQKVWEATPVFERSTKMRKFADVLMAHEPETTALLNQEMAKPYIQAKTESIDAASLLRANAERMMHLYGSVLADNTPGMEGDLVFTKREPLGVMLCIVPFNFPIELTFQKAGPALAAGNSVIIKAPSANPLSILSLEAMALEAGLPKDVFRCIACRPADCTEALIKNPRVAGVSLTGSTASGKQVMEEGAATLKRTFLELGGNDAFIIFEDADVNRAVEEMLAGRLENNGQVCCACKRFIVQKNMCPQLTEALVNALKQYKRMQPQEENSRLTALISEKAAIKVTEQIAATVAQGAELVYGGDREGAFVTPAVLANVPETADVAVDMEIFGPVFPIIPFETEEDAVRIANQSSYGLSSGVLSGDMEKAMRVAGQLKAGAAVINGSGTYRHYDQPFGGFKMSGIGREGTSASIEEFSNLKTYVVKGAFRK